VDEARAALSATSADQRPQVSASANRSRTRVSQRGPTPLPQGVDPQFNDTRVAVGVSYEIDLWGRLRNATQAARAELLASEAARETVLITLTSDLAQGYFALRAFDGQLEATRRSLAARSQALGMQKKRFDVGGLLAAALAHRHSGQRERGALRLVHRTGRDVAGRARGGPADLRGRAHRRTGAGRRRARTPGARTVPACDPDRIPRRARRAGGAGQGARASRSRERARNGVEDHAAVCAPSLPERHDRSARGARCGAQPARG